MFRGIFGRIRTFFGRAKGARAARGWPRSGAYGVRRGAAIRKRNHAQQNQDHEGGGKGRRFFGVIRFFEIICPFGEFNAPVVS